MGRLVLVGCGRGLGWAGGESNLSYSRWVP